MPIPVISVSQMREWETATWASGCTEAEVIARVGQKVANSAKRHTREGDTILVLAGKGHNGDDARAAKVHLKDRRVVELEVADPKIALDELRPLLSPAPDLIVDALFGIGLNRPLNQDWIALIEAVNQSGVPVLSVDVPSGLNADTGEHYGTAIKADVTLTVGAVKTGLLSAAGAGYAGVIEVAMGTGLLENWLGSVASPLSLQWTLACDFKNYPKRREPGTHKGTYGHVALLAGSRGYHGAAVLAARGAQRAQPGLITLFAPEAIYSVVSAQLQAVMVSPWQAGTKVPGDFEAVLVGPGLAAAEIRDRMIMLTRHLWRETGCPLIVDASALDWVPLDAPPRNAIRVLTPHPGEAARLLGSTVAQVQADRRAALRKISQRHGDAWVVLKGHQTLIGRNSGDIFVNSSGNPHLGQGGSGDLLAGFIAGLLAQPHLRSDVSQALRYAVWQHGASADYLQSVRRNWVVEDLAVELGNH